MSAAPTSASISYEALDACHRQIRVHLAELAALAQQIETTGVNDQARQQAALVETFFSSTSRQHHAEEERDMFPMLLASGNPELVSLVRSLQQDHGWIEENWIELGPQLRAIASGNNWFEVSEFQHGVEVFLALYLSHIELEETRIYPESRALWAQTVASKILRTPR